MGSTNLLYTLEVKMAVIEENKATNDSKPKICNKPWNIWALYLII